MKTEAPPPIPFMCEDCHAHQLLPVAHVFCPLRFDDGERCNGRLKRIFPGAEGPDHANGNTFSSKEVEACRPAH